MECINRFRVIIILLESDCYALLVAAFDRVPRQKLFEVLCEYGIREKLLEAIESIYVASKAVVRIDGEISDSFEVNEGVHQDCCLSPLLFIIFMDKIIRHQADIQGKVEVRDVIMRVLAYAVDLILLAENVDELQSGIDSLNIA